MWLNFAITWTCFNETVRGLLTDYAVTISVFLVIFLSNAWSIEKHDVPRIEVPPPLGPTCHHDEAHNSTMFSVNYDCLCSSHQHCTFVNSMEDDSDGSIVGPDVNGTMHSRQWQTSYEARPSRPFRLLYCAVWCLTPPVSCAGCPSQALASICNLSAADCDVLLFRSELVVTTDAAALHESSLWVVLPLLIFGDGGFRKFAICLHFGLFPD